MKTPKVVVITGASAGIGRAVAQCFARKGSNLALIARDAEGLNAAKEEAEAQGVKAITFHCDVSKPEELEAAAAATEAELGEIDVWVNNAMVTVFGPFQTITSEEFRRVTEVTYLGYVHGTHAALKRMLPRDRGVIVQVGSALAYRSIPLQSAYCGAKAAIRGFTDSVRSELHHDGSKVRIAMVHLPAVNTPQFDVSRAHLNRQPQPVPPIFQPEIAARAIVRAAMRPRREVWVGLPVVEAILGQRVIPGILDRYLAKVAWEGQMIDEPIETSRPDNLFEPIQGDRGSHGRFDDRAKRRSPQAWAGSHRGWLAAGLGALAGLVFLQRARA